MRACNIVTLNTKGALCMDVEGPRGTAGNLTRRTHRTTDRARTQNRPTERRLATHNGGGVCTHPKTAAHTWLRSARPNQWGRDCLTNQRA